MSRLLRALLHLYPTPFRERFGEEMSAQIEEDLRRARAVGRAAWLRTWLANATDVLRGAAAERWAPTWSGARTDERSGGVGMRMSTWIRDLRHAARSLARAPGLTAVAIGTLGLGVGVTAGIFSVVDSVLLQPLPYTDQGSLYAVAASAPGSDYPDEFGVSPEFFHQYREAGGVEEVAIWDDFTNTARLADRVERLVMVVASHTLFRTLGAEPMLGRLPTPEDSAPVVVLSHPMWTSWFGADPQVVGRTVFAAGEDRTVIGVMGPEFWFPYEGVQLWIPNPMRTEGLGTPQFFNGMVARVSEGVAPGVLAGELDRLADRIPERFGWSAADARLMERHRPVVRSLRSHLLGDLSGPLVVLLGSVVIVLVIACGNVVNLLLVRVTGRSRELAVRTALGASRRSQMRMLLAESLVLAAGAAVVAVALAWVSVPVLSQVAPDAMPRASELRVTPLSLLLTVVLSVLTAMLCGLVPAIRGSRNDLSRLRDGTRGSTGRTGAGRSLLVAGQTALALVLLVGSGLLARSFIALNRVDPGFDTSGILTFQIAPESEALVDGPTYARFHQAFSARLAALPGVESTGIVENVPLEESVNIERFVAEGSEVDPASAPLLGLTFSDSRYFRAMGIALQSGRTFSAEEEGEGVPAVVVSASAARLLWPDEDPVGRRLQAADGQTFYPVVGVVEDVLQDHLQQEPQPLLYFPLVGPAPSWVLPSPGHVVRAERPIELVPQIRALIRELAPEAPLYRVYTMEQLASESMQALSFTTLTLAVTSLLALVLGWVGLFGILSYAVAQRTREIGVRMALGADASAVRAMVVGQGTRVVLAGVGVGLVVAWLSSDALSGLLYGVEPGDPVTFVVTALGMVGIGLVASYVPARRASRVQPVESLRGA